MDTNSDSRAAFEQYIEKSQKKLVVFVVTQGHALNYGLGTYTANVCKSVGLNDNYDFVSIILDANSEDVKFDNSYGVPFYSLPYRGTSKNRIYKSIAYFIASRLISDREVIFHFNLPDHLKFAIIVKQLLSAKIVYTQHFMEWAIQLGADREELLRRLENKDPYICRKFSEEQNMMLLSDIVIAVAKHSIESMTKIYHIPSLKIRLIPHAIEIDDKTYLNSVELRKKYNLKEKDRILLYVGRLDANKNVRALIQAFSKISHDNIYLWIVGEGHLNLFLNEIPESDWRFVKFWGYQDREKIKEFYSLAEIGIVPSNYEEFGYVALEMMMSGLPIIVNNTSGLSELTEGFNDDIILSYNGHLSSLIHSINFRLRHPVSITDKDCLRNTILNRFSQISFREKLINVYSANMPIANSL